ncbi:DUF4387 domain-containing protein [Rhodoplanes serenus]|uniref:DUF4387 domain-containing protein n=1 Tax=Rhodoplanes serenus TaxID=200615 RepID=UPI000DAC8F70|nr:DUF4387 domain-containing protein [Rhodoplanes serenus]RAI28881.1 acyl-CoA synthetase [Rhodoplanes serenus]
MTTIRLVDIAGVIRSKNAGPFELTLDIMVGDPAWYQRLRQSEVLSPARIAALYGIAESDVLSIVTFDPASAIKITLKRPLASGAVGDADVYGAQQHAPLLGLSFEVLGD